MIFLRGLLYMKNVKLKTRRLLKGVINDQMIIEYFANMVDCCNRKNIHELDVNLQRDIYPVLSKKYFKTEGTVEVELIHGLNNSWKEMDIELYKERFKYNNKPTVKKLLILIIQEIKKQEEK